MAKLAEGVHFSGTVGNVTFYQMWGRTYVRTKSSLTRKRVLKSKTFEKTRQNANNFACAAQIGSFIYKALPANIRERWIYRTITGDAASLLYEGKNEEEVKDLLWKKYIEQTGVEEEAKTVVPVSKHQNRNVNLADASKACNRQLRNIFLERWEKQGRYASDFKDAWQNRGYFNRHRFRAVMDRMNGSLQFP